MITAGIRFHDAGIDGDIGFTLDQACVHARSHHGLEYLAKERSLSRGTGRGDWLEKVEWIRNLVIKIEAAEPAIGEMQFDLLAKLSLSKRMP